VFHGREIKVFFASISVGGYQARDGLQPVCHACEKVLGINAKNNTISTSIPSETMPLVFSAEQVAHELGTTVELIDINQMSIFQRLIFKLKGISTPCVMIGDEFIFGTPTKDELLEHLRKRD
jgi:hypothetical protein